jgi:hypothetical protein
MGESIFDPLAQRRRNAEFDPTKRLTGESRTSPGIGRKAAQQRQIGPDSPNLLFASFCAFLRPMPFAIEGASARDGRIWRL